MKRLLATGLMALLCGAAASGRAPARNTAAGPSPTAPGEQKATNTPAPAASAALPTADQVLAHYVRALGGGQALRKITSRVMRGTFETQERQITGEAEILMAAPDRFRSLLRIPDAGEIILAYDGKVGWSSDPQSGIRDISGQELEQLRRSSQFQHELRFRELFPQVRVLEKTTEGDRAAWVLEATPLSGPAEKFYFEVESGLLVRHDYTEPTSEGNVPIEHRYSNYTPVDGVQVPMLLRHKDPVREWQVKFTEARNNLAIDPAKFARPAGP